MSPRTTLLAPEEAWLRIAAHLPTLPMERVALERAAGRRLAAPVLATAPIPADDLSALDGFAYAGEVAPRAELPVAFTLAARAGEVPELPPAAAARVMTGSRLPPGADRVVGFEATEALAADRVRILRPVGSGAAVRRRAEVAARGDTLISIGERLEAGELGILASLGVCEVEVTRRPRIAILVTGDEVVDPRAIPAAGEVRDSHSALLTQAILDWGGDPRPLGRVGDDPRALEAACERAFAGEVEADLLLTSGGVSMGDFDHAPGVFARLGYRTLVASVAIQPGKPFHAAERRGRLILGLPGNPASAWVTFRLFAAPWIDRALGGPDLPFWADSWPVPGLDGLPPPGERDRFVPLRWRAFADAAGARIVLPRGSHDLVAFRRSDALLRIPRAAAGQGSEPSAALWRP